MFEKKVSLKTFELCKEYYKITQSLDCDVDLKSDRYVIDAKSLLGIFSLDISKQFICVVHTDNKEVADNYFAELKKIGVLVE